MRSLLIGWLALLAFGAVPLRGDDQRECVVLLHGVAVGPWTMQRLASALEAAGYRTVNLGYASRHRTLEQIAGEDLPAALRAHEVAAAPRLHFVTHSMGSLVVRLYLRDQRPANLGRVVMLGPPNQGSAAADAASRHSVLRWLIGVNLERLGTGPRAITRELGAADFELGVIAGQSSINPLFNHVFTGPHDGAVAVEATTLAGMRDHLVVPYSHTLMLWRRMVIDQTLHFLRHGKFATTESDAKK